MWFFYVVCNLSLKYFFSCIRLAKAFEDLQKVVDNELELKETEEYAAAVTALNEAKDHLPTAEV